MAERLDMLGKKQKRELAETGSFTNSQGISVTPGAGASTGTTEKSVQTSQVPVGVMENPQPDLNIPQLEVDPNSQSQAVLAGQSAQAQLEQTQAKQQEDSQVATVRQLSESLGGRAGERQQMREEKNLPADEKALADMLTSIRSQTASLAEFDDETFLGEEVLRGEAGGRDVTKASFGAQAHERRLQRAIDRTGKAAALRVNIASAELLQNNITAAQAQIKEALDTKYSAIEQSLNLEMAFLNRAFQVSDTKDQQAFTAKQNLIQQQLNDITDAKDMVFNAMPYATPEELQAMNDPSLSASEQREKAQEVVARGLRQDREAEIAQRNLDMAYTNAQIAKLTQTDPGPATVQAAVDQMNAVPSAGSVRNVLAGVMGTLDIPATQRTNIGVVFDVAGSLENWANGNQEGEFIGMGPGSSWIPFPNVWLSADAEEERTFNRSQAESINLKVQQWASGAALTEEQTKQVEKITPRVGDKDKEVKRKMNALYNYMLGITETQLVTSGYNIQFPEVNLFELGDLMAEMDQENRQVYSDALETYSSTTPYASQ